MIRSEADWWREMESVGWDMIKTREREEQEKEFERKEEERKGTVWTWLYRHTGSDVVFKTIRKCSDEQEVYDFLLSTFSSLYIHEFIILGKLVGTDRKKKLSE